MQTRMELCKQSSIVWYHDENANPSGMGEYSSEKSLSLLNWDFVNLFMTHFVLESFFTEIGYFDNS